MTERGGKRERMKNIFKKLHIGTNNNNNDPHRSNETTPPVPSPFSAADNRVFRNAVASPATDSPSSSPSTAAAVPSAAATTPAMNRQDFISSEEEFQMQLALAISASNSEFRDDPEKDQIHTATLLSLGGRGIDSSRNKDDAAEALSRHYWPITFLAKHFQFPASPVAFRQSSIIHRPLVY